MSGYDFAELTVLVCDDSRHMRGLITTFLREFGFRRIYEADNADQAYNDLTSISPDLVIMDWNMEGTNGEEFVRRVRLGSDTLNPFLPVIMVTGFTEIHRVVAARDAGVSGFLAKPISAKSLYQRLVGLVDDERAFVRMQDFFGPDRRSPRRLSHSGPERRHFHA